MDEEERKQLIKTQLEKKDEKTKKKSGRIMNIIFLVLAGTLVFGACGIGGYYLVLYL